MVETIYKKIKIKNPLKEKQKQRKEIIDLFFFLLWILIWNEWKREVKESIKKFI